MRKKRKGSLKRNSWTQREPPHCLVELVGGEKRGKRGERGGVPLSPYIETGEGGDFDYRSERGTDALQVPRDSSPKKEGKGRPFLYLATEKKIATIREGGGNQAAHLRQSASLPHTSGGEAKNRGHFTIATTKGFVFILTAKKEGEQVEKKGV